MEGEKLNTPEQIRHSGKWVDRFFDQVEVTKTCWLWSGLLKDGYGRVGNSTSLCYAYLGEYMAHRVSWRLFKGVIRDGQHVLHTCDVRNCVNPEHLYLGTNADNVSDRVKRDRSAHNTGETHGRSKLTWKQVRSMRAEYARGRTTHRKLARKYGVVKSQIYFILSGRNWKE